MNSSNWLCFSLSFWQGDEMESDDMPSPKMSPKGKTISFSINVNDFLCFLPATECFTLPCTEMFSCLVFLFVLEYYGKTNSGNAVLCEGNCESGQLWEQEAIWPLGSSEFTTKSQHAETHTLCVTLVWYMDNVNTLYILYILFHSYFLSEK